jgi:hypothetical protein
MAPKWFAWGWKLTGMCQRQRAGLNRSESSTYMLSQVHGLVPSQSLCAVLVAHKCRQMCPDSCGQAGAPGIVNSPYYGAWFLQEALRGSATGDLTLLGVSVGATCCSCRHGANLPACVPRGCHTKHSRQCQTRPIHRSYLGRVILSVQLSLSAPGTHTCDWRHVALQHHSVRRRGDPHIRVYALTSTDGVRVVVLNENDVEDDTDIILPGEGVSTHMLLMCRDHRPLMPSHCRVPHG